MNRSDASLVLAPTATRGGATVRVIGAGGGMIITTTITITTPPAGTG